MSEDESAIRRVVDRWMAAILEGDLETVLSLMTDDVVFTVPGREPFGRKEFAEASQGMSGMQLDGTNEIVELKVLGEWAFLRARIEMTTTPPDGDPVHRSGYTVTLMRKEADDQWRLARDANLLTVKS